MKKKMMALVLVAAMALSMMACGNSKESKSNEESVSTETDVAEQTTEEQGTTEKQEEIQRGGTLVIGFEGAIANLGYPGLVSGSNEINLVLPVVETLCRYDESAELVPWLAESYETDADALTLTVTLKQGIKFHDGTDFNGEAVKWNWETFMEEGRTEIASIESIECPDEYTVVAHLSQWDNTIADNALYVAGLMFSPTYCQSVDKDTATTHPVGTGAYKFVNWEQDVKLTYEANQDYWIEGKPYMDGIEIQFVADTNTISTSYLSGELDLMPAMTSDLIMIMASSGEESVASDSLLGGSGINMIVYGCNDESSPTSNLLVRQAIAYAIDWETICNSLQGMFYTNQWAIPGAWSYNENVKGYPYNPDEAKKLLEEAGYADGCSISCYVVEAGVPGVTMMQQYLSKVGITLNIEVIDQARTNEMTGIGGGWDGMMYTTGRMDVETASIYERTFTDDGVRFVGATLHPSELVEAISNAKAAKTEEERNKDTQEASRIIIDDYCMISPVGVATYELYEKEYVHNSGYLKGHLVLWTPEECWLSK